MPVRGGAVDSCSRDLAAGLLDRAVDVQVPATGAVPADPLGWQAGVATEQRPEAEVVTAVTQQRVATWKLAAYPLTGTDLIGIQPVPQRNREGLLADATSVHPVNTISRHGVANLSRTGHSQKAVRKGPPLSG